MTKRGTTNIAASVHARLLTLAKARGRPFNELLVYYAIERFLYRLSISGHADAFVLKGALTLLVWHAPVTRPTRDIDLLGRTSNDLEAVRVLIGEICRQTTESDGMTFDAAGVRTMRIAEDADYEGVRALFEGRLGNARIPMQIDIGFSDVITPAPVVISYPVMLDHAAPQLRAYNRETAIAEKLEAMVSLGELNSRMKDFFDVWLLTRNFDFDGREMVAAVIATFGRRRTAIAADPVCFSGDFAGSSAKASQWIAFMRNSLIDAAPTAFPDVIEAVAAFAVPVFRAAVQDASPSMMWRPPGTWTY